MILKSKFLIARRFQDEKKKERKKIKSKLTNLKFKETIIAKLLS